LFFLRISINLFDSSLQNESRLLKSTQMLIEWNLVQRIFVFGFWKKGLREVEDIDSNRQLIRIKLPINKLDSNNWAIKNSIIRKFIALYSIIYFRIRIFCFILKRRPKYLNIHNPTFLMVGLLAKIFINCKLIYVPHELESERTGTTKIFGMYVVFIERFARNWLHYSIFVSPEIEKWYIKNLGYFKTGTIRNIPINSFFNKQIPTSDYLKNHFNIERDSILFIYQGIINQYRGIEQLLKVFMNQSRCHIVFMGFGELADYVKDCSIKNRYVHYHPAVDMDNIISVTSSADISLFFVDEPMTKSYQITTANKFYEGIIAGTPFAISDNFSYMSSENTIHNLGWSLIPQKNELVDFINNITWKDIIKKKENCLIYGSKICWKEEAKILKSIYN
jgi:hypothetical protein